MMNWLFDIETKECVTDELEEGGGSRTFDANAYAKHKKKQEEKKLADPAGPIEKQETSASMHTAENTASATASAPSSVKSLRADSELDPDESSRRAVNGAVSLLDTEGGRISAMASGISGSGVSVGSMNERGDFVISKETLENLRNAPSETDVMLSDKKEITFEEPRHRLYSRSATERKQRRSLLHYPILLFKIFYMVLWAPFRFLNILFLRGDPPNCLKLPPGKEISVSKNVAMSTPIDLARIKRISKQIGGTVNDVIVACTAISLRNHVLARSENDESKLPSFIRCILPISLREPSPKSVTLDNQISAVCLNLPLKEDNPKKVLMGVKKQMDRLKLWPDAFIIYGLIYALVNWCPHEW